MQHVELLIKCYLKGAAKAIFILLDRFLAFDAFLLISMLETNWHNLDMHSTYNGWCVLSSCQTEFCSNTSVTESEVYCEG